MARSSTLRRWIFAGIGVLCVGLGLAGIVLPGLPTTVFLLFASYLFARSSPRLEEKLLGMRVFRPYLRYARGEVAIPLRTRLASLAMMWTAIAISLTLLATRELLGPWLATIILAAGAMGTVSILTWRRTVRAPACAPNAARPPQKGQQRPRLPGE